MLTRTIRKKLQSAESTYRRNASRIPMVKSTCPTIPSVLIFAACIAFPSFGIALFFFYILSKVTGGKIATPESNIHAWYDRLLTETSNGQQIQGQGSLIPRARGDLLRVAASAIPGVGEVLFLSDMASDITNNAIPSLSRKLTDETNKLLPNSVDLSALNPQGNCFGLVIVGFVAKKNGSLHFIFSNNK